MGASGACQDLGVRLLVEEDLSLGVQRLTEAADLLLKPSSAGGLARAAALLDGAGKLLNRGAAVSLETCKVYVREGRGADRVECGREGCMWSGCMRS